MELSIGNKKKKEEPKDTQNVLDTIHTDHSIRYSKEEIQHTEKQIDSLLNKESCDEGINDSFKREHEKKDEREFIKPFEETQQAFKENDIVSKEETWEKYPDLNVKDEYKSEDYQPSNGLDQQNVKKGFSIPKIKIRINKDRLPKREDHEVKKMIPVITSDDSSTSQNHEIFPQETIENTLDKQTPSDSIETEQTNQNKSPSKIKTRWFTYDTDDAIKNKEQTRKRRITWGLSKNKVLKTKEKGAVEHKKQEEETTVSTNDESNYNPQEISIDEDVRKLLSITDELLGKLPEEVIEEF
ncbi:MAG: hypothetical protein QCH96_02100, partial [Candidatus Thermoplasmatota archaeon]|nr:hypothetical protein [Candidatus Thermoplasmatota archaeon]